MDRDAEHLRLLSIFYYVYAALHALLSCFFILYIVIGIIFLIAAATPHGSNQPPAAMGILFILLGGVVTLIGLAWSALIAYTGRCLARREHRTFCFVMACLNCLSIPFGTILGVFTIVVLERPQVRGMFAQPAAAAA